MCHSVETEESDAIGDANFVDYLVFGVEDMSDGLSALPKSLNERLVRGVIGPRGIEKMVVLLRIKKVSRFLWLPTSQFVHCATQETEPSRYRRGISFQFNRSNFVQAISSINFEVGGVG